MYLFNPFSADSSVRPSELGGAEANTASAARRVVVALGNRLMAECLERWLSTTFQDFRVEGCVSNEHLQRSLRSEAADLAIASPSLVDGDSLDGLAESRRRGECRRVLILTDRREPLLLEMVRKLEFNGVLDVGVEGVTGLQDALQRVLRGRSYWSASFLKVVGQRPMEGMNARLAALSGTERFFLSILGGGCDDEAAADYLDMTIAGVHAYRKRLHRKLGLTHKGQLVVIAAQAGLVRFGAAGVERLALRHLRAQCRFRAQRPLARTARRIARSGPSLDFVIVNGRSVL